MRPEADDLINRLVADAAQPAPIGAASLSAEERQILNGLRLEVGQITDGDGATIDDEAVIFFEADDGSSEIRIRAPNATYIATRLADLWNRSRRGVG